MLLIIELLLLCYGTHALITARFKIGKEKVVKGSPARILGGLCLTPFPATFLAAYLYYHLSLAGRKPGLSPKTFEFIAITVLVLVAILLIVLGRVFYRRQGAPAEGEGPAAKAARPSKRALVAFGVCLFPALFLFQLANGEKADLATFLGAAIGSLLGVGLLSLSFATVARFKSESVKR
jgi:hypothetical protein